MACDFYNAGALLPLSDEDRDVWVKGEEREECKEQQNPNKR